MTWLARFFWAIAALIAFLLAALAVNQEKIALEFVTLRSPELSVFWWLLMAFGAGLLLGVFGLTVSSTRLNLRNRRLNRQLTDAQRELEQLKSRSVDQS